MGAHARRASHWRAPAAAAVVGTVAAMLASPPASAVSWVGDTTYGNLKGAALAGWADTLGITAVSLASGKRLVLSQAPPTTQGGAPGTISLTQFAANGTVDTTWGTANSGRIDLPTDVNSAGATVSELMVDGSNVWIVGRKADKLVIWLRVLATGVTVAPAADTGTVITLPGAISANYSTGVIVADVDLHTTVNPGLVVAIQNTSAASTRTAHLVKIRTSTMAVDTTSGSFNGTNGYVQVPAATAVQSLGGIANVGSNIIVGTAQSAGATVSDDTNSLVYRLAVDGTVDTTWGDNVATTTKTGYSTAVEVYSEAQSPKWQNEGLADVIAGPAGDYVAAGKAGNNYFLAKISSSTPASGASTALNNTFGNDGVTALASSAGATDPEIAYSANQNRFYLGNDVSDGTAEVYRWNLSGAADGTFGTNGYQHFQSSDFGHVGSVTAEPITFATDDNKTVIGAGTWRSASGTNRYDAAGWKIIAPTSAPVVTAPTIQTDIVGNPTAASGNAVGGTQLFTTVFTAAAQPTFEWQWAPAGSTNWQTVPDGGVYQYGKSGAGPNWTSTLNVYNVTTAQHGYQYRVVASNSAGSKASSIANLTITGYPVVASQPVSDSQVVGAKNVKFTTIFTPSPVTSVQWQVWKTGSSDWANISGTNLTASSTNSSPNTLTVGTADSTFNGAKFRAIISNTVSGSTVSTMTNPATLTLTGMPVINTQPENKTVEEGHDATFWLSASGTGPLKYQWQWSKTGADDSFQVVPGATSDSYTFAKAKLSDNGTYFQAKVTDANGYSEYTTKARLTVTEKAVEHAAVWGDYNGDGKTDIAAYKDGSFYWNGGSPQMFGMAGDKLVVGNFDSDKASDKAVVRGNVWKTDGNPDVGFGKATDMPVSGDFDGDGMTDIAVWRPSNGTWYVKDGDTTVYGKAGDIPVPADYDGDGADEVAVFRPSTGTWYVLGMKAMSWGKAGDIPVRGDWDGDGVGDVTVYRPSNSTWYPMGGKSVAYGRTGDTPLAGDFDGDGTSDIAVYRWSDSTWYFSGKSSVKFGGTGWWPVTGVK